MSITEAEAGLPYSWVGNEQYRLALAQGLIAAEVVVEPTLPDLAASAEQEAQATSEPLAARYPATAGVYDKLARSAADAGYVPSADRDTFVGGTSATIDSATMRVIEEITGPLSGAQTEAAAAGSGGIMGRVARGVRAKVTQAEEVQREKELREQRERDQRKVQDLIRIHGDPEKALSIFLRGRYPHEDVAQRTTEILSAFQGDPGRDIASLLARAELNDAQQRLLSQQDRRGDLSRLREDMAAKRSEGTAFLASDADRYTHLMQQHAARALDTGAVATRDWYAQRDAARVEVAEYNKPDGKALIVTDENIRSAGLVGPLLASLGIAEIHTAGRPYHEFTRNFLERVTGSAFFKRLDSNDVNQRFALVVLQGQHPPIKPAEFMMQIGEREGDMGIIPGSINQRFVDELRARMNDPRSAAFHGQFTLEERPSSLVAIRLGPDGTPMVEERHQYTRKTYVLVRHHS